MVHRRVLLKGCAAALLGAPNKPLASYSQEPPNLSWIGLRKYASNGVGVESLVSIFSRQLEFVEFSKASTEGSLGTRDCLVIPGPGDLLSRIAKAGWNPSQSAWSERVSTLMLVDGSYKEVSRLLDAGLFPLSFASFGIICKPAQLVKRKANMTFDTSWKQRLVNLSKLNSQGKPPIALGNDDGMSGLYLFSTISLSVVGLVQHSRIISGESFFTLNSLKSILKRIQQLQSFFVGKVNAVSQSDALADVVDDKSLLTFDWTNFQEEFELWDSQQLGYLTIDPVSRVKGKSKLCEFAIEFVYSESLRDETLFNELINSTFSTAQTRLMNNMYTNLFFLSERREQQWPGVANSISNLAASKVTPTMSLALGLPAELAIGGILPLVSDFLEKPTDQNVIRCAESILRLN